MPKFSANIIYLFNEFDLIKRFEAAASVGFKAVECQRPYNIPALTVRDLLEEHQIEMVLVNTPASPAWPHDKGLAVFPERVQAFQETVEIAIDYATKVECPRLHVLAGAPPEDLNLQKAEETFISNLQWTAELGKRNGIKILIEPLNPQDNPGYFLTTAAQAVRLLSYAEHDNLYLQYDLYHAGMNGEDVITDVRNYLQLIEHMQMATVPGRHEPNTTDIELISTFTAIDKMGYEGWIGAEYTPTKSTYESLNWGAAYGIG